MKFKVAVDWSMCAVLEIDAHNLEEAKNKAYMEAIPDKKDSEYIDGSWTINDDVTEVLNKL